VGAYVVAFAAMRLAGIPTMVLVLAGGIASGDASPAESARSALVAAMLAIGALTVVGVIASALVLKVCRVRSALLIGFLGQVADFVCGTVGNQVSGAASYVLGGLANVAVTYALIMWQRRTTT
jgi:hypothetical protein